MSLRIPAFALPCLWFAAVAASGDPSPLPAIEVHPDGAVTIPAGWGAPAPVLGHPPAAAHLHFGLPPVPADRQWLHDNALPIAHSRWEHHGIRYTQIVLVATFETAPSNPPVPILLVQVIGESLRTEYTEATAALRISRNGATSSLELHDKLVRVASPEPSHVIAAIDIEPTGIAATAGNQLRFRGNMPPATTGSMTFKFPAAPLAGEAALNQLRDLLFDDALKQVTRPSMAPSPAQATHPPPVRFSQPPGPAP